MTDVLLPLSIAVPIVAATLPLAFGLWYDDVGWPVAAVTTLGVVGSAVAVALEVYTAGPFDHELGGFAPPIGIELVADELSAAVFLLVALVSAATLVLSRAVGPRGNAFHSAYLLLTGGLVGVSLTGDLFNLFVFLEIVGLTTYALIAADRSGASAYASLKYLVVGTVGASLYLVGVGYVFLATGTLNMADVSIQIVEQASHTDPLVRAGYAFIVAGFALKIALFPVHSWQPDAYQRAPDAVTTVVAALVSTASAYALIRVSYSVFTVDFLTANDAITTGILVVSGVSIVAGSLLAVMQSDLKRMFAYSSVAQFGMIAAAVGMADETALLGGIVHLIGHGLLKFGLFFGLALLAAGYGARRVDDLSSLARRAPFATGALAVLGLALVGIPPSIGFLGKWYIALGAVRSAGAGGGTAGIWIAVVILVSTLFTLAYVARVIERLYFAGVDPENAAGGVSGGPVDPVAGPDRDAGETVSDGEAVADGGNGDAAAPGTVPTAPLAVLVAVTLVAVGLGFAGAGFETLLDPYLSEVFA
ncbi:monovalent cation/H+ antiporter subunit D family protein [Halorubrum sp. 48-1-W]|uniref:proton-conducting transporter transmembrane domain-containing protein n=1 Tax=Halorubrum sp. 48-1-W TaxID=2249761 RepID=UPI000DCE35E2|nr:proton-conducting transporter membrane subunit [Halorubrum sp. 48-1-W]RAW45842.1 monovalent cation/H+ antiporter subunit D family protein [Halorubrum sp. 48-1-W]